MVRQHYEVQVYDEFVILGNTAVLRCHVPSFVREYVTVTGWVRGGDHRIHSDVESGEWGGRRFEYQCRRLLLPADPPGM